MGKAKVYFTKNISDDAIVKIYDALGFKLDGNVAVKLHSGEEGNQNYIRPEMVKKIVEHVNGTVVECNTAYEGARNSTEKHKKLLDEHGWTKYFKVDLMDENPKKDIELDIPNGKILKKDIVGEHLENYDSMLVLSHFKGHPMGGFGGALKQLSIGCSSSRGKALIHSAGKTTDQFKVWGDLPKQDLFLESMADAASAVTKYFRDKKGIIFISLLMNMSVDCDCCAIAEDPCLKDIGIMASLDPVAIDRACIDMVENSNDVGKKHFMERVNSRHGTYTIDCADNLGLGTKDYEIISID